MFKHLLVPLDGSTLAEAAIPIAVDLSHKLKASVTLLHVIEKNAPQEIHGQRHLTEEADAKAYLENIAATKFKSNQKINIHVHTDEVSQVARSIVQHSGEFDPDLIILCAHGEGGLHDFVVGSIPQQVIAAGSVPVILLQPQEGDESRKSDIKCIEVALDGDPEHDHSLHVASDLALAIQAQLHLIRIVPTLGTLPAEHAATGTLLPVTTNAILDLTEDEAVNYLDHQLDFLKAEGVEASAEVERGDPAQEVVKSASNQHADMIVVGTHGKKGMNALWSGSVAPSIIARTQLPILLIPVGR